jgi:hypothetical protein
MLNHLSFGVIHESKSSQRVIPLATFASGGGTGGGLVAPGNDLLSGLGKRAALKQGGASDGAAQYGSP